MRVKYCDHQLILNIKSHSGRSGKSALAKQNSVHEVVVPPFKRRNSCAGERMKALHGHKTPEE